MRKRKAIKEKVELKQGNQVTVIVFGTVFWIQTMYANCIVFILFFLKNTYTKNKKQKKQQMTQDDNDA